MPKRYWLMKVEPESYSIDDFERDGQTCWEGVRNYQARNTLRDDVRPGDGVLFYQSNAAPAGVAGVAEVSKGGYPDHFSWDSKHDYFDPKSSPDNPTWYMVDIRFVERFPAVVSLAELKSAPGLEDMMVTKRGMRLSIQPVKPEEFAIVRKLGRAKTGPAEVAKRKPAVGKAKQRKPGAKKPARKRK
ncbi:MAG: EVE domain-containing protein [Planctomycetes bacterium]|nr:EVE domain-containing protein [Planctomycetota bacterium]